MNKASVLSCRQLNCLDSCRDYRQYHFFRQQFEQGLCPLCDINLSFYKVLHRNAHWSVVENVYAETPHCAHTILIVPAEHGLRLSSATLYESVEFLKALHWVGSEYASVFKDGGMFYARFGDMEHNIDTVPDHFHFTIVIPDGKGSVRIPVFKDTEQKEKIRRRALSYAKRYEAGEVPL